MSVELKEIKSSLARLLASENLTVQHANVRTASFNVKDRVLTCPTLKDMGSELYDTIMGHEVAHALWTPADGWGKEIDDLGKNFHGFLNVVEDARIERLIKAKFPGLNKSFYKGYNDLHNNRDFFKIANSDVAEMLLIDRINLKAKLGSLLDYEFTDEKEIEYFNRAMTTVTFEDVVELAKELYDYAKEELENQEQEQETQMPQMGEQSEDGEMVMEMPSNSEKGEEENESTEQGEQEQSGEESGEQEQGEASEQGEETSKSETQKQQEVEGEETTTITTGAEGGQSEDQEPLAVTERNARESMEDLIAEEDRTVVHLDMPTKIDYSKVIIKSQQVHADFSEWFDKYYRNNASKVWELIRSEVKKVESSNKKVVNYLAKEFEMKKAAKEQARAFVSKTGQLNTNKLFSYKYNEDLFNRKTELPTGKNHGMMFYLDWSGSMYRQMGNTLDQLINLVMFCKRVNIPFEVYAFTDRFDNAKLQEEVPNEFMLFKGFRLIQLSSSALNKRDYQRSLETLVALKIAFTRDSELYIPYDYFLGGTPLDCAVATANDLIPEFQKKNRIEIVNAVFLTDGCSHTMDDYFTGDSERPIRTVYGNTTKIIRDKKSGAQVILENTREGAYYRRATNQQHTKALYEIVKKSTGATMVGFHLIAPRDFISEIYRPYGMWDEGAETLNQFKKEKSAVVTHTGLDELYVIKGGKDLSVDDDNPLDEVDHTATKAKLKTAFKKATGGKVENRVILSRFVEKIAANM